MVARALLVNSLGDSRLEEPKSYDIKYDICGLVSRYHSKPCTYFFHILKSTIKKFEVSYPQQNNTGKVRRIVLEFLGLLCSKSEY